MSTSLIPSTSDFIILPKWDNFRSRTFSFLIYQEWEHCDDCFCRLFSLDSVYLGISPLHDKDLLENGKPDKPHYHGVIRFKNPQSAYKFCRDCLITCRVFPTESFRGAIRYFIHFDNPEKYQYDKADILSTNQLVTESCFSEIRTSVNSDDADELMFLQDVRYLIQSRSFHSELDIAIWAKSNGYGRFFTKYKYQIHSDFIAVNNSLKYIKNKEIPKDESTCL